VKETVTNRDSRDSKIVNFMKPADGVVLLDSTELNFEQTVAALVKIIREAEVVNG
jgi:cytidylate kinase